ncbi:MAG: hypothetical protein ACOZNI_12580 [Myxococcota bacterium]
MFLSLALAHAATTVLFTGDPREALRASAAVAKTWDLRLVTAGELVDEPIVSGAAPPCATPATNAEVRTAVQRAESRIAYQELPQALADLRDAGARLPCLAEPVEASLAARLYFLFGVADPSMDAYWWTRALAFSPDLAWDERFPPERRAGFDRAREARAKAVAVPVIAGESKLWIDGRPAGDTLAPGFHVVQVLEPKVRTFVVDVDDAPLHVLTAPAVAAALASPEDARSRALLDAALAGRDALVYTDGAVWRPGEWTRTPAPRTPPAWVRPTLGGAGAAALAVGGTGFALGQRYLLASRDAPAGETGSEFHAREASREEAAVWTRAAAVTAGAGAALVVAGLVTPAPVRLWVGPGIGVAGSW